VVARDFALGSVAYAMQANTDAVRQFIHQSPVLRIFEMISEHNFWLMLFCMAPLGVQSWIVSRARRRREQSA
jgi:hypothetical protein